MMSLIRHSIIMITYNQENLLSLALDSIFTQSSLPYEVIIGDDCSTDSTWDVVEEYYKKYPKIIKPIKNSKNLGVFGNFNNLMRLPTGDIVSCLSGDDLYKPGLIETFNEKIIKNNLDPQSEKFILISNSVDLYPSKKEILYDNYRFREKDLFKLKIRYALNFRDTGFSLALFKEIDFIREDLGYHADWIYTIDQLVKSDKFIFIDKALTVYRIGQGVVSELKAEEFLRSRMKTINQIKQQFKHKLDKSDIKYLNKELAIHSYSLEKSFKNLVIVSWLFFINLNNYILFSQFKKDLKFLSFSYVGYLLKTMKLRKNSVKEI